MGSIGIMSEKRFELVNGIITDMQDDERMYGIFELVDKLNEQQATIKSKDKQLERLYNYFQDSLKDEMSAENFSEMWDTVKVDERW